MGLHSPHVTSGCSGIGELPVGGSNAVKLVLPRRPRDTDRTTGVPNCQTECHVGGADRRDCQLVWRSPQKTVRRAS